MEFVLADLQPRRRDDAVGQHGLVTRQRGLGVLHIQLRLAHLAPCIGQLRAAPLGQGRSGFDGIAQPHIDAGDDTRIGRGHRHLAAWRHRHRGRCQQGARLRRLHGRHAHTQRRFLRRIEQQLGRHLRPGRSRAHRTHEQNGFEQSCHDRLS